MSLLNRTTGLALAALIFGTGCLGDFIVDAISSILLDYEIDHPRVLAMSLDPPILAHNVETTLDALIVGPAGAISSEAVWKTCGLRDDVPTHVDSLQCFAESVDVSLIANGSLPATYEMPDLSSVSCDENVWFWDTGLNEDSGWDDDFDAVPCTHQLPLLIEAQIDQVTVQGVLHANWFLQPWDPEQEMPKSGRQREFELEVLDEPAPGEQIRVEFQVEGDLRLSGFQWYVDEGELEKTSLTAAQRYDEPAEDAAEDDEGRTWTDNLWTLPEKASGTYRIWVVWEQPWEEDIATSVPDIVWTQAEVTLP